MQSPRPLVLLVSMLLCASPLWAADYVAKVNGTSISTKEVDSFFKNNPKQPDNEQNRRAYTDILIARELLYQDAKKKKLDQQNDVKSAVAAATRQILLDAAAEHQARETPLKESIIKERYEQWVKNLPKDQYKVRHIMLKTEYEAKKVVDQLRSGKSFAELASQSLDEESGKKGGEIGWIAQGQILPEVSDALPSLKVNQVADPIKTDRGWDVLEVMEKRPLQAPEFQQVKERIQAAMRQEGLQKYIQELYSAAKVERP